MMRRRDFIRAVIGAAAAWPVAGTAQQTPEPLRRVGVVFGSLGEDDPAPEARVDAFQRAMAALGWTEGQNLKIEIRLAGGNVDRVRKLAADVVALAPDVILVESGVSIGPVLEQTRTIPIVFVNAVDPVGSGFVASLAHPGGNATGFMQFEYRIAGKWLELLKAVAPETTRVAVVRDPRTAPGIGQYAAIQALAPDGLELFPVNAVSTDQIERDITAFARASNGGLIVTSDNTAFDRKRVISLAAKYRLPAIYPFRYYAVVGGLISYGAHTINPTKLAAGYIDRILKGEKPADLPVQAPNNYELVVNLKTAKALNLSIPPSLVGTADRVIE